LRHLDLFSGIGGFSLGLKQAGFDITNTQFSEIDKYAISVYQKQFKEAEYVGSITDVQGTRGQADIITFGSPCQDFSLAGKRKGMGGQRSSLISEAIRLIGEIRPKFFIWENVKGTFSSNDGADFWAIIQAFANIGDYRLEWQLLNTSWFLPHNRERIYLVGTLGEGSGRAIFPLRGQPESNTDVQRQQTNTNTILRRYGNDAQGTSVAERELNAQDGTVLRVPEPTAKGYAEATEGDSINFSQPSSKTRRGRVGVGVAQTLDTACNQGVVRPISTPDRTTKNQNGRRVKEDGDPAFTLTGQPDGVISDRRIRRLTPVECERLQGFPDGWTEIGKDGENISDTQRYKMCGNAVSVPVVKAVGENILLAIAE